MRHLTSITRMVVPIAVIAVASGATGGVVRRQHLTVSESNYRLQAPGLQSLHGGLWVPETRIAAG